MRDIFRQTCINHFFELEVAKAIKQKHITIPTYLSLGTEHIPPVLATKPWIVFPQHRCHSYFLSFGGTPESLAKELLGKDGCNHGMGGSASVSIKPHFFGHSGLLGDQVPIAVGYADASKKNTLVIVGDAGIEEDYALSSLGYAASKNVPILFLVEDNDLSILTKKDIRRKWNIVDVAMGFGVPALEIEDDPQLILNLISHITLPFLVNIKCCRHYWHAGAGQDQKPEWDRFQMFKDTIPDGEEIAEEERERMEELWQHSLSR